MTATSWSLLVALLAVQQSGAARLKFKKGRSGKIPWAPNLQPPLGSPCSVVVTYEEPSKVDLDEIGKKYEHEAHVAKLKSLGMLTLSYGTRHPPCMSAWKDFKDVRGVRSVEFDTPLPGCALVDDADNLYNQDPFLCGCLDNKAQVFCKGEVVHEDGSQFNLTEILGHCPFPYCARGGCGLINGAIKRGESECECEAHDEKVFCSKHLVADRIFKVDEVISNPSCAGAPHCAHPECGMIKGAEPQALRVGHVNNEKFCAGGLNGEEHTYRGNLSITLDECQEFCDNEPTCKFLTYYPGDGGCSNCTVDGQPSRCRLSETCSDLRMTAFPPTRVFQRTSAEDMGMCQCQKKDHVVFCGNVPVARRKFNLSIVLSDPKCTHPFCYAGK